MNCGSPLSLPCFDFTRCRNGITVYVYDQECSLADSNHIESHGFDTIIRRAAKEARVLADTYESACFFINADGKDPQCATTAPLWNEGRNHVMFDIFDQSRDKRRSYSGSYAIEAATSQHTCYYRTGYDISIGHCPKVTFHELQPVPPDQRRYFLTFKGTLHLKAHGSEERESIRSLHDDTAGIVVAEKCPDQASIRWPELGEKCAELLPRYHAYDYSFLMNSTFGLVPAGASPGTYRLGEVMSAGCIPVIVARDFVKPFPEHVDWSAFSFTFSPDEVPTMLQTLRSVPLEELTRMKKKSLHAYWEIYGDPIFENDEEEEEEEDEQEDEKDEHADGDGAHEDSDVILDDGEGASDAERGRKGSE
eukprot:g16622.t1